jgi:hypothetical protein
MCIASIATIELTKVIVLKQLTDDEWWSIAEVTSKIASAPD